MVDKRLTAACSAGSVISFNATTTTEANFGSSVHQFVGNTFVVVNETNGLFDPGDNLNPTGAANLNGALVTFAYGGFDGSVVSGRLMTDNFAAGDANCRATGTILNG